MRGGVLKEYIDILRNVLVLFFCLELDERIDSPARQISTFENDENGLGLIPVSCLFAKHKARASLPYFNMKPRNNGTQLAWLCLKVRKSAYQKHYSSLNNMHLNLFNL